MNSQNSRNKTTDLLTQVETVAEVVLRFDPQLKPNVLVLDVEQMSLDVKRIMTDLAFINEWLEITYSGVASMMNDLEQRCAETVRAQQPYD